MLQEPTGDPSPGNADPGTFDPGPGCRRRARGCVTRTPEPEEVPARLRLAALGPDECRAQLARNRIGRVVFVDARGPVALPVNYGLLDDDIVFRTAASSSLLASSYVTRVGFEVDEIDERHRAGWSVPTR